MNPETALARVLARFDRRLEAVERLLAHQERTYSDALERTGVLDDQAAGDRRFARRIEELLKNDRPIIVGPWTGEVGFELIYWIPFVRWVVRTYGVPIERLLVVSRGGTAPWYGPLATRYADAFEYFSTDEFRTATAEARKQRRVGDFDAALVERVVSAHGLGRVALLHPGLMYRLFMPFWKNLAPFARIERYADYARFDAMDDPALRGLPSEFVAARFYFSDCFPDTPGNREFIASTIDSVSRQVPVVLLNTPFTVDDHADYNAAGNRVVALDAGQMPPARNLAVQSAVISRARTFAGTYGGYSYLAPLCGVNSLAFYSNHSFKSHHLQVAQETFARLGGPSVVPLDVAALPAVRLALSGALVGAS